MYAHREESSVTNYVWMCTAFIYGAEREKKKKKKKKGGGSHLKTLHESLTPPVESGQV
jgi:hypothetical protein